MNEINYLIISNTIDFSTDLICIELEERGLNYLRINRDKFLEYRITYDLERNNILIIVNERVYKISDEKLKAIYFRAPVFLRNNKTYGLDQQLYRNQWSSFIRNLVVFDKCQWINHPQDTYIAENKMYQLKIAREVDLIVPKTIVTNIASQNIESEKKFIVKSLDTALFYNNDEELFTYSTCINGRDLKKYDLRSAPIIIQDFIENKIDIRVTTVGNKVFPVQILKNKQGIDGDWRKTSKELLEYVPVSLPFDLVSKIIKLMNRLNLKFGGIDLMLVNDTYYFVEVNPTGEWGWLQFSTNVNLAKVIVDYLENGEN